MARSLRRPFVRPLTAVHCLPGQHLRNEQFPSDLPLSFTSSSHTCHSHSLRHRAQSIHHAASPFRPGGLSASSVTSLSPLRRSSLYLPLRLRTSSLASAPPGGYSSPYARCPTTTFSVQVSSASSVRPYARVPRSLTGLFPNAVNAAAGGGRGRNYPRCTSPSAARPPRSATT